jgi:ribosomal protein S14
VTAANENTLDARFAKFHAANPHVYAELVRLAREARQAGRQRVGIKELFEVCRWHLRLKTTGDDAWRLNNSLTSSYARFIVANETDLANLFETRRRRSP